MQRSQAHKDERFLTKLNTRFDKTTKPCHIQAEPKKIEAAGMSNLKLFSKVMHAEVFTNSVLSENAKSHSSKTLTKTLSSEVYTSTSYQDTLALLI